jgi:hypothetical protein
LQKSGTSFEKVEKRDHAFRKKGEKRKQKLAGENGQKVNFFHKNTGKTCRKKLAEKWYKFRKSVDFLKKY